MDQVNRSCYDKQGPRRYERILQNMQTLAGRNSQFSEIRFA